MKRCTNISFSLLFYTISYVSLIALASAGDRSDFFQRCLSSCNRQVCTTPSDLSLALRLTRWTCSDDCAYTCMHQITDAAIASEQTVLQYYGKWPFWRLAGIQEPASVLFSLLNFWVHLRGLRAVRRAVPNGHPMKRYMVLWSVVSMNAWICSTIFHVRDRPTTEKLDYFSAALVFVTALHSVVSRFLFINRSSRKKAYSLWTALCILAFLSHITYLSLLPRFDYSYNIIFNLVIGLLHNFCWLIYALPSSLTLVRRFPPTSVIRDRDFRYRPRCASKAAWGVAMTMSAMGLELLDFPPIGRVLDAHALWHAATVPITEFWYGFLIEDSLDEGWRVERL